MENLITSYYDWLKQNVSIDKIGDHYEEITPFLDRYNDSIIIYYNRKYDEITISDGGYILDEMELLDINIQRGHRKKLFDIALNSYGLSISDGQIITKATQNDFYQKKHLFIQGIKHLDDMYLLSKPHIKNTFADDVSSFLDENDIIFTENVQFAGKSGLSHNVDILVPNKKLDMLIKVQSKIQKIELQSILFMYNDISNTRKKDFKFYLITDDTNKVVKEDFFSAMESYNVHPLVWSNKEQIKHELSTAI